MVDGQTDSILGRIDTPYLNRLARVHLFVIEIFPTVVDVTLQFNAVFLRTVDYRVDTRHVLSWCEVNRQKLAKRNVESLWQPTVSCTGDKEVRKIRLEVSWWS